MSTRILGRYEIKSRIGAGAMGVVWLAEQLDMGRRPVALKELTEALADDDIFKQRLRREAIGGGRLNHDNVVRVYEFGEDGGVAFIALEYVDGIDLARLLKKVGTLPLQIALGVIRDLIRGLEAAHAAKLLHRDLKPGNVLISSAGVIKIGDFGLARVSSESSTVTYGADQIGTPAYMSPEQIIGSDMDVRSDIFSLGIIAYELLMGPRPFGKRDDSRHATWQAIQRDPVPRMGEMNPCVPPGVVALVTRMLEKDPQRRPRDVSEVRREFDLAVSDLGYRWGAGDMLAEYMQEPGRFEASLRKNRITFHLNRGLHLETLGQNRTEDATLEYRRTVFLDPENDTARTRLLALLKDPPIPPKPPPKPRDPIPDVWLVAVATLVVGGSLVVLLIPPRPPSPDGHEISLGAAAVTPVAVTPRPATPGDSTVSTREPVPESATLPKSEIPASLILTSWNAGMRAWIDGKSVKPAPNGRLEGLSADRHTIRVLSGSTEVIKRTIDLNPGQTLTIQLPAVRLPAPPPTPPATATIRIKLKPQADLYVDGALRGHDETYTEVTLPPGPHEIRAHHRYLDGEIRRQVVITPGETREIVFDFESQLGRILVITPGFDGVARIYLGDQDSGVDTPGQIEAWPGSRRVSLRVGGSEVAAETVNVSRGKTITAAFEVHIP